MRERGPRVTSRRFVSRAVRAAVCLVAEAKYTAACVVFRIGDASRYTPGTSILFTELVYITEYFSYKAYLNE